MNMTDTIKSRNVKGHKVLETPHGWLQYKWRNDLEIEEHEGYIPEGYSKTVLELALLEVDEPGKGRGDILIRMFLECPEFQEAELVCLEPCAYVGLNAESKLTREDQVRMLARFYRRYGFRSNPKYGDVPWRMWIDRLGRLTDEQLPI